MSANVAVSFRGVQKINRQVERPAGSANEDWQASLCHIKILLNCDSYSAISFNVFTLPVTFELSTTRWLAATSNGWLCGQPFAHGWP
jgi:hypothetical protein